MPGKGRRPPQVEESRPGDSFGDSEVAEAYLHRPDYADAIYRRLVEISPGHRSLLDLGCGTGKIARRLAGYFESVTALDASGPMLRIAALQCAVNPHRISWIQGLAEEVPFAGAPFDLVVAGASIHWMDHARVFPKLLGSVASDHVFAVVDGDGPHEPPWQTQWNSFLAQWIYELKGEVFEPDNPDSAFAQKMNSYRRWLNVAGELIVVAEPIRQRVEHFIACQHSRDTFTRARLGGRLGRFDAQLRAMLMPYAREGVISYRVGSKLVWGTIRHEPDDGGT